MKEWIVKRRRGWTREASLPTREGERLVSGAKPIWML